MLTANEILRATTITENQNHPWQEFERQLKAHDWYYDRSDDYSVYAKGKNQKSRLWEMFLQLKQVDEKKAKATWNKIAPKFFKMK